MTIRLHDYQQDAVQDCRVSFVQKQNPCIVLPTGGGKTYTSLGGILGPAIKNGKRVLWVAHLGELLDQAAASAANLGITYGLIKAGRKRDADPKAPLQIASIQTLARREWPEVDIVVVDEAHRTRGATYDRLLTHYREKGAWIVFLTATPQRLDGKGLGKWVDTIVEPVTVRELIERGFLCDYRYFAPYVPNMGGAGTLGGDFNPADTAAVMDQSSITGDIVATYQKRAHGRKALVFASGIAHSQNLMAAFRMAGYKSAHLDGDTPEPVRREVFAAFHKGDIDILCNAALFFEGVDVPDIGCIIMARPTQSLVIHKQSLGRGLRTAKGKKDCVILDHAGNALRHGLPDTVVEWSLEDKRKKKQDAPKVKRCQRCGCINPPHATKCGECGAVFMKQPRQGPVQVQGELEEVKAPTFTMEDKREKYAALLKQGRLKGWKLLAVKIRYKATFKVWPRGMKDLEEEALAACRHIRAEPNKQGVQACRFCGAAVAARGE